MIHRKIFLQILGKSSLFIFVALLLVAINGCNDLDFIHEKPKSDYFLTDVNSDVLKGLSLGIYEPLARSRGRLWESWFGTVVEASGEYAVSVHGGFNNFGIYNYSAVSQGNLGNMWTTFYQAIGRANFLIFSSEDNSTLAEEEKNQAVGEGKFVRALCYYQLVRCWGKVPMRLTPVSNADNIGQPLEEIASIYEQIIADLMDAKDYLPVSYPPNKAGRATQGAALTMLADVYLTIGDFENARKYTAEVMSKAGTFGYNLEPSLALIYSPSSPTNVEDVFSIKFAQVPGQGSFLPAYAHDFRAKAAGLAPRGFARLHTYNSVPLIRDWDDQDLRKKFNLYNTITIDGEELPAEVYNNGDYLFGKYIDPDAAHETACGNDFYLYRYADALLIFAEAENQLNGPSGLAYDAINQLRRRAYGLPTDVPDTKSDLQAGMTKEEFDDAVFRERGYEFFFECKRWFDLKRTGRLDAMVQEAGIKEPPSQGIYWPIPDIELANNPDLN